MKDNFDLKKFLTENKTIENSNPYLKENQYEKDAEADDAEHIDALEKDMADDKKASLRKKVREMIINELGGDPELDYEGASEEEMYGDYDNDEESYYQHSHKTDIELEKSPTDQDANEYFKKEEEERYVDKGETTTNYLDYDEESLDEAKEDEPEDDMHDDPGDIRIDHDYYTENLKEEETEEEETEEEETEEVDVETEEEPETGGGIEDIAADMEGNEGDLMDHLISALKVSKGMDNEKLTTQIGNTLKFFVGEYIGGEE